MGVCLFDFGNVRLLGGMVINNLDSQLLVASTQAAGDGGGIQVLNQDKGSLPQVTGSAGSAAEISSHGMLVFLSDK